MINRGDGVMDDSKVETKDVEREGGEGRGYDTMKKMTQVVKKWKAMDARQVE